MSSSDYKAELVDSSGEADMSVSVVGDQVVDLSGASEGQVLAVQSDGTVAPEENGGRELSYAEIVSTFTQPSDAENDVTGLVTPAFVVPTTPFFVEALMPINNGTTGQGHQVRMRRSINGAAYAQVFDGGVQIPTTLVETLWMPYRFRQRPGVDAGLSVGASVTYKVTLDKINSGALSILATGERPGYIRAFVA